MPAKLKALGAKLLRRVGLFIRNRAKPTKGLIASGITYAVTKAGLSIDPTVAFSISTVIFAAVASKVYPIFGLTAPTPEAKAGGPVSASTIR